MKTIIKLIKIITGLISIPFYIIGGIIIITTLIIGVIGLSIVTLAEIIANLGITFKFFNIMKNEIINSTLNRYKEEK